MQVFHYLDASGKDLFQHWLDKLRDMRARVAVQRRIDRLGSGNFGDSEFCRAGVWELRIDVGPGYRAYYAKSGAAIVLLLCGGDKRTQDKDIKDAIKHWKHHQQRTGVSNAKH